jgi:hypothetical protein
MPNDVQNMAKVNELMAADDDLTQRIFFGP